MSEHKTGQEMMSEKIRWDATTYDRVSEPQVRWGSAVLDRLDLRGDERVLDAGCGSGRLTEVLATRLPHGLAVGLDASETMVALARARLGPRVPVIAADLGARSPFARGSFDALFSTATFHWVRDQQMLYRNLGHVVRSGGRLAVQCGGAGNIATVIGAVAAAGGADLNPWTFATPEEARARLEENGFVEIEAWLHPEPTPFSTIDEMATFLATCVLNPWLDRLPEREGEAFARAVAERVGGLELPYVRLNLVARKL